MTVQSPSKLDAELVTFIDEMCLYCQLQALSAGDELRQKGQYYRNMYLITHGACDVALDPGNPKAKPLRRGPGDPIGEIGFLRGVPATANVTAVEDMQVMVIDDAAMSVLDEKDPALMAELLRRLSAIADDRTSYNLVMSEDGTPDEKGPVAEIRLCRNDAMLEQAQRLRYDVYCTELGRNSPAADEKKRTIADELDGFTHCFVAVLNDETIGTIRTNYAGEGPLGCLQELYGMPSSIHFPEHSGICTKLVVKRDHRGGSTALRLVAAATEYALKDDLRECYIDCIPKLFHYYRAMGFTVAGETFFHPENGPSIPMLIDLTRHGDALTGNINAWRMMGFYLKAKALKFSDKIRGINHDAV